MSKSKVDLVIVTPGTTGTDDSSDSERSSFHLDEMIVGGHDDDMHPSTVILTAKSMVISLMLVVIVGFAVGTVARNRLLNSIAATTRPASGACPYSSSCSVVEGMSSMEHATSTSSLPSIRLFNSNGLYEEATPLVTIGTNGNVGNQITTIISTASPSSTHDDDHNEEDEPPSGQHLMIDMKDVDSTFLNSKEHIASAMVNLIKDNDMEMVLRSYHCSSDDEGVGGVTCFGVLDEGHISLRTWPMDGVLIMDVYTFGKSDELISFVDTITMLFAIQEQMSDNGNDVVTPAAPSILWSHRLRGFRDGFANYKRYTNPLETDLGADMLKMHYLDKKVQLVSAQTMFQHVDIYEVMNLNGCVGKKRSMAKYEQSLLINDGSYESLHPEMYRPDKILYLDGVLQSTYYGDAAYHEALVHPPMITHPNPKRVAIIGGGEGATLREVLKHNTIEEVVMIEIDGELVGMCREHLPEWSDCSDFIGSDANSCFDDSRANVSFQDAFGWFITNFGGDSPLREKFDVIIMDALDPDKFGEIVGALYKDDAFTISLFKALSDDGIFIVQMGSAVEHDDPSLEIGPTKDTQHFMNTLEKVGFESMSSYDEGGRSGFYAPWSYLICFKSSESRASWYDTSAAINIKLHQRIHKTKSGKPTLLYFDGPTMVSYQLPARSDEIVDCRKLVTPWECKGEYNGIDPKTVNPMARLEDHKKGIIDQNPMGTVISPLFERKSKQILAKINGPIVR